MKDNEKKLRKTQLLNIYKKEGFGGMSDVQKLELLLSYANVSEPSLLAAELLGEYGSINSLVDADPLLLMKNKLMNEQAVVLLKLIPCVSKAIYTERFAIKSISSSDAAKDFFASHFIGAIGEQLIITAVSTRMRVVTTKVLAFGSATHITASYRDIAEMAVKSDCTVFFAAHNHPHGAPTPSESDIVFTKNLIKTLSKLGAVLADHIIVGADSAFSMRESGLLPEMRADGVKGYKCGK